MSEKDLSVNSNVEWDEGRVAEVLIPVRVEFEHLLPSFVSRHVRRRCRQLMEQAVGKILFSWTPQDSNMKGPVCTVRNSIGGPSGDRGSELCRIGKCFCDLLSPSADLTFMSLVTVDISGFCERMAQRGSKYGLEEFSRIIKQYFDRIIHTILIYRGDIVKFAGDSVIACWRPAPPFSENEREETAVRAYECACELVTCFGEYQLGYDTESLRLHIALAAGDVYDVHVGVVHSRWEHFVAGVPVTNLFNAQHAAKGRELSVTHEAFELLSRTMRFCTGSVKVRENCVVLDVDYGSRRLDYIGNFSADDIGGLRENECTPESCELYKTFVSKPAVYKLELDIMQSSLFFESPSMDDLFSFHEVHKATSLFVLLRKLPDWSDGALDEVQSAMETVMWSIRSSGGFLRQANNDDKGTTFFAFFGLPPAAYMHCESRAVRAALDISKTLGERASIGVATGMVFIGGVGNGTRTEYCVLGESINLSARLMCLPSAAGAVLCDEETVRSCLLRNVEDLGERVVRGFPSPVHAFRLRDLLNLPPQVCEQRPKASLELVGLDEQREIISSVLEGQPQCAIIEAGYDRGLTSLFRHAVNHAERCNLRIAHLVCRESNRFDSLRSITHLSERILALTRDGKNTDALYHPPQLHTALACSNGANRSNGLLPLLCDDLLVSSPIPQLPRAHDSLQSSEFWSSSGNLPQIVHQQETQTRRCTKYTTPLAIMSLAVNKGIVVAVHEMQSADASSWALLWNAARKIKGLRLLLFSRKKGEGLEALAKNFGVLYSHIDGLSRDAIAKLVIQAWPHPGVTGVSQETLDMLETSTGGSPYHIASTITLTLEQRLWSEKYGLLSLQCALPGESGNFGAIVRAHVNVQGPEFRLLLKVLSAAGCEMRFDEVLFILHRMEWFGVLGFRQGRAARNKRILHSLDRPGFLHTHKRKGQLYVGFCSPLVRDIVYYMCVNSQRVPLHALFASQCLRDFAKEHRTDSLQLVIFHCSHVGLHFSSDLLRHVEILARHQTKASFVQEIIAQYFRLLRLSENPEVQRACPLLATESRVRLARAHWNRKLAKLQAWASGISASAPLMEECLGLLSGLPYASAKKVSVLGSVDLHEATRELGTSSNLSLVFSEPQLEGAVSATAECASEFELTCCTTTGVDGNDIMYVDDTTYQICVERESFVVRIASAALRGLCRMHTILGNRREAMRLVPQLISLSCFEECPQKTYKKNLATAALGLAANSSNTVLIAKCMSANNRGRSVRFQKDITRALFYLGAWNDPRRIVMLGAQGPQKCNEAYGVIDCMFEFILSFHSKSVEDAVPILEHLFSYVIRFMDSTVEVYSHDILEIYKVVTGKERKELMGVKSRNEILKIASSAYLSASRGKIDIERTAKQASKCLVEETMTPVTLFAAGLILTCFAAKGGGGGVFARKIASAIAEERTPRNFTVITLPLRALASAVTVMKHSPIAAAAHLRSVMGDRAFSANLYMKAVFLCILRMIDPEYIMDDPLKIFSSLDMFYHAESGLFGVGVPEKRRKKREGRFRRRST